MSKRFLYILLGLSFVVNICFGYVALSGWTIKPKEAALSQVKTNGSNSALIGLYDEIKEKGAVKGIPDDYARFEEVLQNPIKSRKFYDLLKESNNINNLPDSFSGFCSKYNLPSH